MKRKAAEVDLQRRVRPRPESSADIKTEGVNSRSMNNDKSPDEHLGPEDTKTQTSISRSDSQMVNEKIFPDAATMASRDSGYASLVSNRSIQSTSATNLLGELFILPQDDAHYDFDNWNLPQPLTVVPGNIHDIFAYAPKITNIRNVIRQHIEQSIDPIVDYNALYRAAVIDAGIREWSPASSLGHPRNTEGLLYRQTMWIYLWLTLYPPQNTHWKPNPRITTAVRDGVQILSHFEPKDQTLLLTPAIVIGCGAFEAEMRQPIRVALAKAKVYTEFGNSDADKAAKVLEEVWRLMDKRDERSWDWQSIAHGMGISFPIVSTWDTASIVSVESLITDHSMSSVNPASIGGAAEEAVEIFLSKAEISSLIAKGFESMAQDRFERNFNRLLKEFATNLRKEATDNAQKSATRLIHHYRAFMTRTISKRFAGDQSTSQADALDDMKKQEASKLMLERLLSDDGDQSTSQVDALDNMQRLDPFDPMVARLSSNIDDATTVQQANNNPDSDCDGSDSSDGGGDALPNLTRVKEFIISSDAFEAFTKGLHEFVNPHPAHPSAESFVKSPALRDIVSKDDIPVTMEHSPLSQVHKIHEPEQTGGPPKSKIQQADLVDAAMFSYKAGQLPGVSAWLDEDGVPPPLSDLSSADESSSVISDNAILDSASPFEMVAHSSHELRPPGMMKIVITRLQKLVRARPQSGDRRVEWTCGCGESLYADFQNGSMDAVNCLATILQSPSPSQNMRGSSTGIPLSDVRTPIPRNPSTRSSVASNPDSSISSLPRSVSSASSPSSDLAPYVPTQSYLEVCINTGEYTKTLSEIDLRDVSCDGELFRRIRAEYRRLRGFRSRFWLLKPSGVHFVRFAVEDPLVVGILQKPLAIPPPCEVNSKNYAYTPCPLEDDPPIPQHTFLHLLSCTAYNPKPAWLPRLPKKLDSSILRFTGAVNYGWGIHINEGPDYFIIGVINFVLLALSGLTAFLWNWYNSDFQGAFGFAGWIVAVVNGVLVAYIVKWQQE